MKANLKTIFRVMLVLLSIALACLFFSSCSSTKKLKQKESYKTEVKKESDSSGTVIAKVDEKQKEETAKKVSEEKKGFDVKVKDGKEVSIKEYDQNGKLKGETVIKGDGEVKTSSEKKDTEETTKSEASKTTDSKADSYVDKKRTENTAGKKLALDLEKKGFSITDYIFWLVLVIILIGLIYLNYRFKWFPIAKKENDDESK